MTRAHPFTLLINAGGQSRRMGQTKALLPVPPDATPLLAHIVRRLRPLADRTVVITNQPDLPRQIDLGEDVLYRADDYPGAGALGGIATGLQVCAEWAITVACDLPFVNPDLIAWLCDLAMETDADGNDRWDVILPVVAGYEQTLHALYHRRCLAAIERRLQAGERRVVSFLEDVRVRAVDEEEVRRFDPDLRSFYNANTPEEWAQALQWMQP